MKTLLVPLLLVLCSLPVTAKPQLTLRLAEIQPQDYPTTDGDREFARRVAELSNGRIEVVVYPNGALGDEVSVVEQLQFGGIDLARVSIASVQVLAPRMAALFMPYLYRDDSHQWNVLRGPIGGELLADLEKSRIVGLGWFEAGARSFYTVSRPVKATTDLRNLHIRVQENPLMASLLQAFGAVPVPLAFSAVYGALRTADIDGAENNLASYFASGHYKVARYFTLDEHARLPEVIIASSVALSEMPAADRELLRRAAVDAAAFQRKAWADYESKIRRDLEAAGVVFLQPTDMAAWRKTARSVWVTQPAAVRDLLGRIQNTQ